ncbi:MAG: carboxypeptidase regulatory-like domain-containing protein [Fimbriimonadales bacterium]
MWRISTLSLGLCLTALLRAFAGAGNLDFYVYDLKTGGEVRAYTARLVGTGGYDQTVTVGNTNYVRFGNVPTNQLYTLTVSKNGYYSRSIYRIVVSHNNTRSFSLGLTPTEGVGTPFALSGRVVDAVTNQPIANAYVEGYRDASWQSYRRVYAITDSQGRFTFENCIPGTYVVWAWREGYYNSPELNLLVNSTTNDLLLPCAPHGTALATWQLFGFYDALDGRVLRSGECLLQSEAGWTMRFTFWSSDTLERLPANLRYNITVRYINTDRVYYPSTRVGFRFVRGETNSTSHYLVPNDVQVGSLAGVVRNMLDGAPVANAFVQLRYGNRQIQSMYTDNQGRYTFNNVPRDYRGLIVDASKPGWRSYSWRVPALTASSNTNDIFICPNGTPTGGLYFYVRDENADYYIGEPILQITLPSGHSLRVDLPDGNYHLISGLPAWQVYDLTMTASGYRASTYLAQSVPYNSERTITFYLRRSTQTVGTLRGTVRDLMTGNPIAGARVSAYSSTRTDNQGRYTLSEQPIGTFDLSVSAPGYRARTVQVTIPSGDTIVDFFLVPAEYPSGRVYGYVRDAVNNGWEIPNSTVVAVAPNGLTLTYRTAPDSGYYNFPNLPFDMPFTFVASASGYNSAQVANFWPRQGDSHQIDFNLTPSWGGLRMGRALKGRVQLEGYHGDVSSVWLTVEAYQYDALVWRQDVRLEPDGSYEVHCPLEEIADLRLKADRWISLWLPAFDLSGADALPEARFALIGDVNNDDLVDDADLMEILLRFGQKEVNAPDLNGDGWVDDADLMLVLFHFGAQGR